jgi:rhomboid protease GluP
VSAVSGTSLALAYVVVLLSAVGASATATRHRLQRRRPVAALAALLLVGVPSLLQLTVLPGLLGDLERDRTRILSGQVWRLVTSLVVQDGGVVGAVANLGFLAVVGLSAARLWRDRAWITVALASGLGGELWGLVVQPVGGGNSVVNFGLAGSMAAVAVLRGPAPARVLGGVTLLGGLALLVGRDLHGGALAVGAATGLLLTRTSWAAPPR